ISRWSACCGVSPSSIFPPGNSHLWSSARPLPRCAQRILPLLTMAAPTTLMIFVSSVPVASLMYPLYILCSAASRVQDQCVKRDLWNVVLVVFLLEKSLASIDLRDG